MIEQILAATIFIGLGIFAIYQYRKTIKLRKAYEALSQTEKDRLNKEQWHNPTLFAYSKPMSKSMWVSSIIGLLFFVWALYETSTFLV